MTANKQFFKDGLSVCLKELQHMHFMKMHRDQARG